MHHAFLQKPVKFPFTYMSMPTYILFFTHGHEENATLILATKICSYVHPVHLCQYWYCAHNNKRHEGEVTVRSQLQRLCQFGRKSFNIKCTRLRWTTPKHNSMDDYKSIWSDFYNSNWNLLFKIDFIKEKVCDRVNMILLNWDLRSAL